MEQPIITWEQHQWLKSQLHRNKELATRNLHRFYLARGIVRCAEYGESYHCIALPGRSQVYACRAAQRGNKLGPVCLTCQAKRIKCGGLDADLRRRITNYIEAPSTYLGELTTRSQEWRETEASIEASVANLRKEHEQTIREEQRAFRQMSEEAFDRERRLIQAQRSWLSEEIDRKQAELEALRQSTIDQDAVATMVEKLKGGMDTLSEKEWTEVLEILKTEVKVFSHGEYEVIVSAPAITIALTTPRGCCGAPPRRRTGSPGGT